jgi:hypothetical protein
MIQVSALRAAWFSQDPDAKSGMVAVWTKSSLLTGAASTHGRRTYEAIEGLTKQFIGAWLRGETTSAVAGHAATVEIKYRRCSISYSHADTGPGARGLAARCLERYKTSRGRSIGLKSERRRAARSAPTARSSATATN